MKRIFILLLLLYNTSSYSAAGQIVTMVTDEWPPYYGSEMYQQGPVTEIAREVLKQLGYQFELSFTPWKRAVASSKSGQYHAVLGGYYNKQRAEHFWYSQTIASSDIVLFTHFENKSAASNISALSNKRVCVINGYFYGDEFKNNKLIERVNSNSLLHCFERLIAKRVDYLAANRLVGLDLLNNALVEYKDEIVALPLILSQEQIYILWSKQYPDNFNLNVLFNKKLKQLTETGEIKYIWQQHGY